MEVIRSWIVTIPTSARALSGMRFCKCQGLEKFNLGGTFTKDVDAMMKWIKLLGRVTRHMFGVLRQPLGNGGSIPEELTGGRSNQGSGSCEAHCWPRPTCPGKQSRRSQWSSRTHPATARSTAMPVTIPSVIQFLGFGKVQGRSWPGHWTNLQWKT